MLCCTIYLQGFGRTHLEGHKFCWVIYTKQVWEFGNKYFRYLRQVRTETLQELEHSQFSERVLSFNGVKYLGED